MAKRPMARDITEKLRGKVDPAVLEVLVGLAEYQNVQRQHIQQCANLVNGCADGLNNVLSVMGAFKIKLDKFDPNKTIKGLDPTEERE